MRWKLPVLEKATARQSLSVIISIEILYVCCIIDIIRSHLTKNLFAGNSTVMQKEYISLLMIWCLWEMKFYSNRKMIQCALGYRYGLLILTKWMFVNDFALWNRCIRACLVPPHTPLSCGCLRVSIHSVNHIACIPWVMHSHGQLIYLQPSGGGKYLIRLYC